MAALGGLILLAASAQAQISFRAAADSATAPIAFRAATRAGVASGVTSLVISVPAGTSANDVMIAAIAVQPSGATINTPVGWTFVARTNQGNNNTSAQAIYRRVAGAAEPASYTWTLGGGPTGAVGGITTFSGVDTVTPILATAGRGTARSLSHAAPSVTTTYKNTMTITAHSFTSAATWTPPPGMTEAVDVASIAVPNAAGISMEMNYAPDPTDGATGTRTATASGNADNGVARTIALRPSLTIPLPPGTVSNDVMIASIGVRPSTVTITPPAGWILVRRTDQGAGTTNSLAVYRKVASAAEPARFTWVISAATGATGGIQSFSGVDTVTPIDVENGASTASALAHSTPSIVTTVPNTMLVASFDFSSSATWTPPAGMTEGVDVASRMVPNAAGIALEASYAAQAAAGATGAKTATASGNADTGNAHLLALRPITLAHYAIAVASTTVANCDYAQITISGHDASHGLVNPPAGRSLALSTSVGSGVWQAGTVAGTGAWTPSGANNGAATYLWPGGESSFTVRLRQSAVTSLTVNLNDGSVAEAALEDPTISFVDSAFRISNGANSGASIGTQIAGKASNTGFGAQTLYLQAVRTDTATGACVSLFPSGSDVSVEVGAQCNNPAACARNVTLTSSAAASNTAVFVPNGGYPASMNFRFTTGNAEAPFALNYADAGQITLQFRRQLPAPPAGQYVQGASNGFVVRPFGFAFTGVSHDSTPSGSPAAFAAGDNFSMTVGAYLWASGQDANNDGIPDSGQVIIGNGVTPNFAATIAAGIAAGGNLAGVDGTLTRAGAAPTITAAEWLGGTAAINNWRYSEVGNVRLTAAANDYLGDANADIRGDSSNDGAVGYIGRFRPKQFVLSAASLTTRVAAACSPASAFTYMNERLRLAFTLTAQNTQGATTQNYNNTYAKLVLTSFGSWDLGARNGATDLTARVEDPGAGAPPTGSWSNGVASGVTVTTALRRATPDNPDGPYPALEFGVAPIDSDSTAMNTLDLGTRKNLGVTTEVRYGRLRMDNALGAEARRLAVPMRVEFWNGTGFATNIADSCTSIGRSAIALAFTPPSNLTSCETAVDVDPVKFASGVANVGLNAPGAGNSGSVVLTANLGSGGGSYCNPGAFVAATSAPLSYLLGRWDDAANPDGDANTAYDDKPSARAVFGLYGSQPGNFIYFRESYQ